MEKFKIIKGDITTMDVDAVVNPNNTHLISGIGNGVNGAIIKAGGSKIAQECKQIIIKLGVCEQGQAIITTGGNLPAKYVIHTVPPVWKDGKNKEEVTLTDCYENSLRIAVEKGLKTVAIPNLGTGNYQFPKDIAAEISVETIHWFLRQDEGKSIDKIYLVCHNEENYELCKKEYDKLILV